jgi:hypothetical protein
MDLVIAALLKMAQLFTNNFKGLNHEKNHRISTFYCLGHCPRLFVCRISFRGLIMTKLYRIIASRTSYEELYLEADSEAEAIPVSYTHLRAHETG